MRCIDRKWQLSEAWEQRFRTSCLISSSTENAGLLQQRKGNEGYELIQRRYCTNFSLLFIYLFLLFLTVEPFPSLGFRNIFSNMFNTLDSKWVLFNCNAKILLPSNLNALNPVRFWQV